MKNKLLLVTLGIMMIIFAGCTQTPTETTENTEVPDTQNQTDSQETQTSGNESEDVRVIEIDAFNFGYSQEEIRVEQGERVRVVMTSTEGNHDFVIDELGAQTEVIGTGDTTTVEFVADQQGEFSFYCSVGSHRELGMEGTFIVE